MLLALCSRSYCGHPGKTGHFHPSIHQHKTEKGIGKVGPCLTEHQEREMRGNKSNKTERLNLKMSNYLYPRHVAKPSSPEGGIRKQEEKSFQYITTRQIATFANAIKGDHVLHETYMKFVNLYLLLSRLLFHV